MVSLIEGSSFDLLISSAEISPEELQDLTRELCITLSRETDAEAKVAEGSGGAGTRGDPVTVGTIILTFLTSGAAVGLFNVLKSYFERSSTLEIEFKRKDGNRLKIRAQNLRPDQIKRTMATARKFFGVRE